VFSKLLLRQHVIFACCDAWPAPNSNIYIHHKNFLPYDLVLRAPKQFCTYILQSEIVFDREQVFLMVAASEMIS
jgi:hypothetical protein